MKKNLIRTLVVVLVISIMGTLAVFAAPNTTNKIVPKSTNAIKGTPVIDGKMDNIWNNAKVIDVNLVNKTLIKSNTTTKAKTRTMWDTKNLYIYSVITDQHVWNTATKGNAPEDKDSIEFSIDEANNKKGANNVAAKNPAAGVFRIGTNKSEISGFGDRFIAIKSKVKGKCVVTKTGYIVEVAIPWSTIKPKAGTTIGMEVQINDNDKGAGRSGLVTWNSAECLGWRDTAYLGNVVLTDPKPAKKK